MLLLPLACTQQPADPAVAPQSQARALADSSLHRWLRRQPLPACSCDTLRPGRIQLARQRLLAAGWRPRQAYALVVDPLLQRLYLLRADSVHCCYPVSTSRAGISSREGTIYTPPGLHAVRERYGYQHPVGAVFRSRVHKPGEIAHIRTEPIDEEEDLITTRILWLEGLEEGINKGKGVDSYRRYIYIHGTHEEGLLGQPASHGCIRMGNRAIARLYPHLPTGTLVEILRYPWRPVADSALAAADSLPPDSNP